MLLYAIPIPRPQIIPYQTYNIDILLPERNDVKINPAPERIAEIINVFLNPIFLLSKLPKIPPKQKKLIVSVKFTVSCGTVHPKFCAKGTFNIDQA